MHAEHYGYCLGHREQYSINLRYYFHSKALKKISCHQCNQRVVYLTVKEIENFPHVLGGSQISATWGLCMQEQDSIHVSISGYASHSYSLGTCMCKLN